MTRYEFDQPIEKIKSMVNAMSDKKFMDWLGITMYAVHPELYRHRLPSGLEFVSGPQAINCYDFAQGCRGKPWIDHRTLLPSGLKNGNLTLYYEGDPECNLYLHAGIVIENGARVISQWGVDGAVFKHQLLQIPRHFGIDYRTYHMPMIT